MLRAAPLQAWPRGATPAASLSATAASTAGAPAAPQPRGDRSLVVGPSGRAHQFLGGSRPPLPFLGRRRGVSVFVVPVPPFVGRALRVALRRVLPVLLAAKGSQVEVAPGVTQCLVAAP